MAAKGDRIIQEQGSAYQTVYEVIEIGDDWDTENGYQMQVRKSDAVRSRMIRMTTREWIHKLAAVEGPVEPFED